MLKKDMGPINVMKVCISIAGELCQETLKLG